MPGPKHGTPRKAGNRSDPNGHARKPNAQVAKRLAARQASFVPQMPDSRQVCHMPGSQNRKK